MWSDLRFVWSSLSPLDAFEAFEVLEALEALQLCEALESIEDLEAFTSRHHFHAKALFDGYLFALMLFETVVQSEDLG